MKTLFSTTIALSTFLLSGTRKQASAVANSQASSDRETHDPVAT